jgi:hypothetical protein
VAKPVRGNFRFARAKESQLKKKSNTTTEDQPQASVEAIDPDDLLDYAKLKACAKELHRPATTLTVLQADPFAITPDRRELAEWFAKVWRQFGMGRGGHITSARW